MSNSSEVSSSAGFVLAWQGDLFEGTVQATSLFLDAALDMSKLQTSHPGSISHSTWFLVAEDVQVLLNLYCGEPCRWNDGAVRWRNISVASIVACSFHCMCVSDGWEMIQGLLVFEDDLFSMFLSASRNLNTTNLRLRALHPFTPLTKPSPVDGSKQSVLRMTFFLAVRPSSFQHMAVRLYSVCSQQAGWYFVGL